MPPSNAASDHGAGDVVMADFTGGDCLTWASESARQQTRRLRSVARAGSVGHFSRAVCQATGILAADAEAQCTLMSSACASLCPRIRAILPPPKVAARGTVVCVVVGAFLASSSPVAGAARWLLGYGCRNALIGATLTEALSASAAFCNLAETGNDDASRYVRVRHALKKRLWRVASMGAAASCLPSAALAAHLVIGIADTATVAAMSQTTKTCARGAAAMGRLARACRRGASSALGARSPGAAPKNLRERPVEQQEDGEGWIEVTLCPVVESGAGQTPRRTRDGAT